MKRKKLAAADPDPIATAKEIAAELKDKRYLAARALESYLDQLLVNTNWQRIPLSAKLRMAVIVTGKEVAE